MSATKKALTPQTLAPVHGIWNRMLKQLHLSRGLTPKTPTERALETLMTNSKQIDKSKKQSKNPSVRFRVIWNGMYGQKIFLYELVNSLYLRSTKSFDQLNGQSIPAVFQFIKLLELRSVSQFKIELW